MNRLEKRARDLFFGASILKRDLKEAKEAVQWAKENYGRLPLYERYNGIVSLQLKSITANESLLGRPHYERSLPGKFKTEKLPENVLARIPFPGAQQADRANRNMRIYAFDSMRDAILKGKDSASKRSKEGQFYLGGGHAGPCEIHKMSDCAGLIHEINFDDTTGQVGLVVDLLDTPQGDAAFKIMCAGGALPISSVAFCQEADFVTGYEGRFGTLGKIYEPDEDVPDDAPMYCVLSDIYFEGWDCVLGTQGVESARVTRRDAPTISVRGEEDKKERATGVPRAAESVSGRSKDMEERIKQLEAQLKAEQERADRLASDFKRAQEESDRLRTDVVELRKVDVAKHVLDARLAAMTERVSVLDTLKAELDTLKAESVSNKAAASERDTLKAALDTLKAESADLKKRLSAHDDSLLSEEARQLKAEKADIEKQRKAIAQDRAQSTLVSLLKDSKYGDLTAKLGESVPRVNTEDEAKVEFERLEKLVGIFGVKNREGMEGTPKTHSAQGPAETAKSNAGIPSFNL